MDGFVFIDELKVRKSSLTTIIERYHGLDYYVTIEILEKRNQFDSNSVYVLKIYREKEGLE